MRFSGQMAFDDIYNEAEKDIAYNRNSPVLLDIGYYVSKRNLIYLSRRRDQKNYFQPYGCDVNIMNVSLALISIIDDH